MVDGRPVNKLQALKNLLGNVDTTMLINKISYMLHNKILESYGDMPSIQSEKKGKTSAYAS